MPGSQDRAHDIQGLKEVSEGVKQVSASGGQLGAHQDHRRSRPSPMLILRVGLPGTLMLAGIALLLVNATAVGLVLISVAAISAIVDFFAQLTITSGDDREREERARSTFLQTGSWPRRRS